MKKVLLIIAILVMLTGCGAGYNYNEEYYNNYANTVVGLFRSPVFDANNIYSIDLNALNEFSSTLTHQDQIIDVTDYIIKDDVTTEPNSNGVVNTGNSCTIEYRILEETFDTYEIKNPDAHMEAYYRGICNGRYFTIYESDLFPKYEITQSDPRYDYILLRNQKEKDAYIFYYRSTYDGSGLKVTLELDNKHIVGILIDFTSVDGIVQGE